MLAQLLLLCGCVSVPSSICSKLWANFAAKRAAEMKGMALAWCCKEFAHVIQNPHRKLYFTTHAN